MPLQVHPLLLLLLVSSLPSCAISSGSSSCAGRDDAAIVAAAFRHVRNFRAPRTKACQPVRALRLPSRNLTGAVSWAALANLSALAAVDLSGNALQGAIPGGFWRAPSLRAVDVSRNQLGGALRVEPNPQLQSLNVSGNRFTGVDGVEGLSGLVALDVSTNRIRAVPRGLRRLTRLKRLDLSSNGMRGWFPGDLPPLGGVRSLNVSYNKFSGVVDTGAVTKFGHSAFVHAGNASLVFSGHSTEPRRPRPSPPHGKSKKNGGSAGTSTESKATRSSKKRKHLSIVAVAVICGVVSLAMLLCLVGCVACGVLKSRQKGGKDDDEKKPQWGEKGEEEKEEDVVVAAARGASAQRTGPCSPATSTSSCASWRAPWPGSARTTTRRPLPPHSGSSRASATPTFFRSLATALQAKRSCYCTSTWRRAICTGGCTSCQRVGRTWTTRAAATFGRRRRSSGPSPTGRPGTASRWGSPGAWRSCTRDGPAGRGARRSCTATWCRPTFCCATTWSPGSQTSGTTTTRRRRRRPRATCTGSACWCWS
uniref:Uncharacterized protein n=1 Tax=Zea mays TaxID=4577 RepID=A0A804R6K6_MAIZE